MLKEILIRFDKWILRPINLLLIILSVYFFARAQILNGIFCIVTMFFIGLVGQSLHKDKNLSQLIRGEHLQNTEDVSENKELTIIESRIVTNEFFKTAFILAIFIIVFAFYYKIFAWWIIILIGLSIPLVFIYLCGFVIILLPQYFNKRKKIIR